MSANKVSLHRVIKASPDKVFSVFTQAPAITSWLPSYGFLRTVQEMNVEVGGSYKMSFHNFTTGSSHSFGGQYVEIKPNEFFKYTDQFDDPNMPGIMTTSIWLQETSVGTKLKVLQEGIPAAIPAETCYLGWQESLEKLIKLLESQITDA